MSTSETSGSTASVTSTTMSTTSSSNTTSTTTTTTDAWIPLSVATVHHVMDSVLGLEQSLQNNKIDDNTNEPLEWLHAHKGLVLERVQDWSAYGRHHLVVGQDKKVESNASTAGRPNPIDVMMERHKTPWYFGISILQKVTKQDESNTTTKTTSSLASSPRVVVGLVSFYLAYSSWNGRILYVDRLDCPGKDDDDDDDATEQAVLRLLAQVAVRLDCARLTWRHTTTPAWHLQGDNRPEMHAEVLTLSMNEQALADFVAHPAETQETMTTDTIGDSVVSIFDKELVESAFATCLDRINRTNHNFCLRQVTQQDLNTMTGLVQGLADYCQESDAVHLSAKDYIQDGFLLDNPLWYGLLVDKKNETTGEYVTCGYAFFFVGYILGQGRFIYLEDLYLQVAHRGGGGGTIVMKTLAALCRSLQCTHLYWQALEWNTAGLAFYDKTGAKIHHGEKTSRYATNALQRFAKNGTR